jgi:hypothetical protein
MAVSMKYADMNDFYKYTKVCDDTCNNSDQQISDSWEAALSGSKTEKSRDVVRKVASAIVAKQIELGKSGLTVEIVTYNIYEAISLNINRNFDPSGQFTYNRYALIQSPYILGPCKVTKHNGFISCFEQIYVRTDGEFKPVNTDESQVPIN